MAPVTRLEKLLALPAAWPATLVASALLVAAPASGQAQQKPCIEVDFVVPDDVSTLFVDPEGQMDQNSAAYRQRQQAFEAYRGTVAEAIRFHVQGHMQFATVLLPEPGCGASAQGSFEVRLGFDSPQRRRIGRLSVHYVGVIGGDSLTYRAADLERGDLNQINLALQDSARVVHQVRADLLDSLGSPEHEFWNGDDAVPGFFSRIRLAEAKKTRGGFFPYFPTLSDSLCVGGKGRFSSVLLVSGEEEEWVGELNLKYRRNAGGDQYDWREVDEDTAVPFGNFELSGWSGDYEGEGPDEISFEDSSVFVARLMSYTPTRKGSCYSGAYDASYWKTGTPQ